MGQIFALFLSLLCISCTQRKNRVLEEGDFTRIPLFFLPCSGAPLLKAEIDGMDVCLKVDLGAACDMILKERILEKIQNKEFRGMSVGYGVQGNQHMSSLYWIPKITIGNLGFEDAISTEETMQMVLGNKIGDWSQKEIDRQFTQIDGRIGSGILSLLQCYFDLPHKALFLARNLEEIRKCYCVNEFVEVPFEFENGHVILNVDTDFGRKKLLLDTGATASIFRSAQAPDEKKNWVKITLSFEGLDFGQWEFFLHDFTDRVLADGALGIDFFKKHGIHLDFEHRKAYIQRTY